MALARIDADIDATGKGSLTVNGQPLDFRRASIAFGGNDITRVIVEQAAEHMRFVGDGVVEITRPDDEPVIEAGRFLRAIDPAELESAALARLGLDGDLEDNATKAMLAVLVEWAEGKS